MFKRVYHTILDRLAASLYHRLQNYNDIKVDSLSAIHPSVVMRGARLRGDIRLGEGVKLLEGVHLKGKVYVGKYTSLNGPNTSIFSLLNPVHIGSFCSIARNVVIQEYNHNYERLTSYYFNKNLLHGIEEDDITSKGAIEIGHDVWIGAHSVILSGAKIGNGVVVAANSVVTGNIPSYSIVAGIPAKVLKYRFDVDTVARLEKEQWWNLPKGEVIEYFKKFQCEGR